MLALGSLAAPERQLAGKATAMVENCGCKMAADKPFYFKHDQVSAEIGFIRLQLFYFFHEWVKEISTNADKYTFAGYQFDFLRFQVYNVENIGDLANYKFKLLKTLREADEAWKILSQEEEKIKPNPQGTYLPTYDSSSGFVYKPDAKFPFVAQKRYTDNFPLTLAFYIQAQMSKKGSNQKAFDYTLLFRLNPKSRGADNAPIIQLMIYALLKPPIGVINFNRVEKKIDDVVKSPDVLIKVPYEVKYDFPANIEFRTSCHAAGIGLKKSLAMFASHFVTNSLNQFSFCMPDIDVSIFKQPPELIKNFKKIEINRIPPVEIKEIPPTIIKEMKKKAPPPTTIKIEVTPPKIEVREVPVIIHLPPPEQIKMPEVPVKKTEIRTVTVEPKRTITILVPEEVEFEMPELPMPTKRPIVEFNCKIFQETITDDLKGYSKEELKQIIVYIKSMNGLTLVCDQNDPTKGVVLLDDRPVIEYHFYVLPDDPQLFCLSGELTLGNLCKSLLRCESEKDFKFDLDEPQLSFEKNDANFAFALQAYWDLYKHAISSNLEQLNFDIVLNYVFFDHAKWFPAKNPPAVGSFSNGMSVKDMRYHFDWVSKISYSFLRDNDPSEYQLVYDKLDMEAIYAVNILDGIDGKVLRLSFTSHPLATFTILIYNASPDYLKFEADFGLEQLQLFVPRFLPESGGDVDIKAAVESGDERLVDFVFRQSFFPNYVEYLKNLDVQAEFKFPDAPQFLLDYIKIKIVNFPLLFTIAALSLVADANVVLLEYISDDSRFLALLRDSAKLSSIEGFLSSFHLQGIYEFVLANKLEADKVLRPFEPLSPESLDNWLFYTNEEQLAKLKTKFSELIDDNLPRKSEEFFPNSSKSDRLKILAYYYLLTSFGRFWSEGCNIFTLLIGVPSISSKITVTIRGFEDGPTKSILVKYDTFYFKAEYVYSYQRLDEFRTNFMNGFNNVVARLDAFIDSVKNDEKTDFTIESLQPIIEGAIEETKLPICIKKEENGELRYYYNTTVHRAYLTRGEPCGGNFDGPAYMSKRWTAILVQDTDKMFRLRMFEPYHTTKHTHQTNAAEYRFFKSYGHQYSTALKKFIADTLNSFVPARRV